MPSKSKKQQRFMKAELTRKLMGKPTRTGMSVRQLRHYTKLKSS